MTSYLIGSKHSRPGWKEVNFRAVPTSRPRVLFLWKTQRSRWNFVSENSCDALEAEKPGCFSMSQAPAQCLQAAVECSILTDGISNSHVSDSL